MNNIRFRNGINSITMRVSSLLINVFRIRPQSDSSSDSDRLQSIDFERLN